MTPYMKYSKKWYEQEIGAINGIKQLIIESSPGKTELLVIVYDGADGKLIAAAVAEKMQVSGGLVFEAHLTILKIDRHVPLNDFYGKT